MKFSITVWETQGGCTEGLRSGFSRKDDKSIYSTSECWNYEYKFLNLPNNDLGALSIKMFSFALMSFRFLRFHYKMQHQCRYFGEKKVNIPERAINFSCTVMYFHAVACHGRPLLYLWVCLLRRTWSAGSTNASNEKHIAGHKRTHRCICTAIKWPPWHILLYLFNHTYHLYR